MNSSTEPEYITVTKDSTIEEKIAIIRHSLEGGKIEYLYENVQNRWRDIIHPSWDFESVAYRYKKPQKIQRIQLGPEDFPPGSFVKNLSWIGYHWKQVIAVSNDSIHVHNTEAIVTLNFTTLFQNNDWQRSIDGGRTWLPCYKEV